MRAYVWRDARCRGNLVTGQRAGGYRDDLFVVATALCAVSTFAIANPTLNEPRLTIADEKNQASVETGVR